MKCIYLRTNLVNGKQYVGQTNDYTSREYDWKCLKAKYANNHISNARKKYGLDNWSVEILKECNSQDELNTWEKYYIKQYSTKHPNGYNLTDGGNGISGFKHSDEAKKKMSESTKGKKHPQYGKPISKEAKEKSMLSQPTRKIVYQYSIDGKLINVFKSVNEAARQTGYNISEISVCCHGGKFNKKRNKWVNVTQYKGYKWSYKPL